MLSGSTEAEPTPCSPDRERWNRKYRGRDLGALETEPAEWLVVHRELLERQPRGAALDVACGGGRHAIYLARLGFEVDAFDVSDVVIAWLREQVRRQGLPVHTRRRDLERQPLPRARYQVIALFNYLERSLFAGLREALVPGGLLFFETFTRDHRKPSGRLMKEDFTLEKGELCRAFDRLEILDYREVTLSPQDPRRARAVASLVARKPKALRTPAPSGNATEPPPR